jgi:hypothetical protein
MCQAEACFSCRVKVSSSAQQSVTTATDNLKESACGFSVAPTSKHFLTDSAVFAVLAAKKIRTQLLSAVRPWSIVQRQSSPARTLQELISQQSVVTTYKSTDQ